MSDLCSFQGDISESQDQQKEIPRLDRITNPSPSYSPSKLPPREQFNINEFKAYQEFIQKIIPNFTLSSEKQPSEAIAYLKETVDNEWCSNIYCDLLIHEFLYTCSCRQNELIASPSLTKGSILHHELYQCSEIIHNCDKISFCLADQCAMLMADTADMYHNHFSDITEHKFWGKTKSVNDLINVLLKKEFERLRLLNPYTYQQLSLLAMRKAIDSAPSASVNELVKWAHSNKIPFE